MEQYRKQYLELASKYLPESKLLPGALRLVKHLAKHSIPMALCTGSNTFEFETKMQKHQELLQLISLRVSKSFIKFKFLANEYTKCFLFYFRLR